jgi:hypothetical protein
LFRLLLREDHFIRIIEIAVKFDNLHFRAVKTHMTLCHNYLDFATITSQRTLQKIVVVRGVVNGALQ